MFSGREVEGCLVVVRELQVLGWIKLDLSADKRQYLWSEHWTPPRTHSSRSSRKCMGIGEVQLPPRMVNERSGQTEDITSRAGLSGKKHNLCRVDAKSETVSNGVELSQMLSGLRSRGRYGEARAGRMFGMDGMEK